MPQKNKMDNELGPLAQPNNISILRNGSLSRLYLSNNMIGPQSIESLVGRLTKEPFNFRFSEGCGTAAQIKTCEIKTGC